MALPLNVLTNIKNNSCCIHKIWEIEDELFEIIKKTMDKSILCLKN